MAEVKPSHDTSVCWCTVGLYFACQSAWMLSSRWLFAQEMHVSIYSVADEVHWPAEQQMYRFCWQTREADLFNMIKPSLFMTKVYSVRSLLEYVIRLVTRWCFYHVGIFVDGFEITHKCAQQWIVRWQNTTMRAQEQTHLMMSLV